MRIEKDSKVFIVFSGLAVIFCLMGCASTPTYYKANKDKSRGSTLTYSPDLRSVHLITKDGKQWIIAEPTADVALDASDSSDFSLSLVSAGGKNDSDEDQNSSSSISTALPGRTPSLLLARELNYRLAEMAFNTDMQPEKYHEMFSKIISTIQAVSEAEIEKSTFTHSFSMSETTNVSETLSETATQSSEETATQSSD